MADFNQFGSAQPSGSRNKAQCAQCEAMLADALDHTLSPDDQAIFDLHLATCGDCTRMYMDARRGADWLVMLKTPQPEPSSALLDRIFASTSRAAAGHAASDVAMIEPHTLIGGPTLVPSAAPAVYGQVIQAPAAYAQGSHAAGYAHGNVIPFRQRVQHVVSGLRIQSLRHTFMQPRLAMTAAMAFFSVALTLNLTGVHLTQLRASDLKPSSLKRSFYDTNARVVRSIDNLRVVYELESRVQDLQRHDNDPAPSSESAPSSNQNNPSGDQKQDDQKAPEQQKRSAPRPRSGSSSSIAPGRSLQYTASATLQNVQPGSPRPAGRLQEVSFFSTPNVFKQQQGGQA